MKIAALVCRILLGLMFLVFGVFKLYPFRPAVMPPGDAGIWSVVMIHHHWMMMVGVFESVGGLLLLSGRFVPLGLALLAPICVNILAFQFLLVHGTPAPALVPAILELFLLYAYRNSYAQLLVAKAQVS